MDLEEALGQLDRLLLRLRFEDRIAADHFLRLGERAVNPRQPAAAQAHAHAFSARPKPGSAYQPAGARHFLYQLAHVAHELFARYLTGVLLDTDHRKESHSRSLL